MNVNAKCLLYIAANGITQAYYVVAGGSATVYKHQCLAVVNTCIAKRAPLPSTAVYHPSGWDFILFALGGSISVHYIVRHVGPRSLQPLEGFPVNDRVHKETACITLLFRVGKFIISYVDDSLAKLLKCRFLYVATLQF